MNDTIHDSRRLRRAWPPAARTAAAIVLTAGLCLLAAACSSSPSSSGPGGSSNTGGSTSSQKALAFSQCMRSHGVLKYPDPDSSGGFPKESPQQLGVSVSRFEAAQSACRHLLPNGGSGPTPAQVAQARAQALKFSQCVRKHGVTNFPDPGSDGRIPDPASVGIDQGSPQFQAANQACRKYRPPYIPSNAAYDTYATATAP